MATFHQHQSSTTIKTISKREEKQGVLALVDRHVIKITF